MRRASGRLLGLSPAIWLILAASALPELVLSGADLGLWGTPRWRLTALAYAAFWAGLLGDWVANYRAQPVLMFLTYGFLHAGFWHFAANMAMLVFLGNPVAQSLGSGRFLAVYGFLLVAGALGFAVWPDPAQPMVGASGALFGLAGMLLSWDLQQRRARARSIGPVVQVVALLFALNVAYWWTSNGQLAWQTHLGGFVAGWVIAGRVGPQVNAPGS